MGTIIPLYGYVNPYAHGAARRDLIERPDLAVGSVDRLLAYISRDDVKALKERVMFRVDFDAGRDAWAHPAVDETDPDVRPVLGRLLREINMEGSIVVPTIEDIKYPHNETTFELVERILCDGVPVIAMDGILDEQQSLKQFAGRYVADLRVFECMWQNSMSIRRQLEAFAANKDRALRAYNQGVEPNNGVGVRL
jgi:hypothetical protein